VRASSIALCLLCMRSKIKSWVCLILLVSVIIWWRTGRSIVRYSYETLKSAAQGFLTSYKIGGGGFGSVYKVIMYLNYLHLL